MFKYLCHLFSIACLTFLYSSCERYGVPYAYSLTQAEQFLPDRPDSAKRLLDAFRDSLAALPDETTMYYNLLLVKAEDRCSVRPASDSLIAEVIRYYEKRKDRAKRMDAYYYGARVYAGLQDTPRALEYFQKAADLAADSEKYDFLAGLYNQMGALLVYQERYGEALLAYKKAYTYQLSAPDSFKRVEPLLSKARIYHKMGEEDEAVGAYLKADELAQKTGDAPQASEILNEMGEIYIDRGQYEEASEYFRRSLDQSEGKTLASVYLGLGRLFLHAGRLDSAFFYLHKSMEKGDVYVANRARKELFYLEDKRSNYKQALAYAEQHILSYDSIQKTIPSESALKAQELYNYQKTEAENRELKLANARKRLFIREWLLVCFFLLTGLFFFVYRLQRKKDLLIRMEKKRRKEKEQQYRQSLEYIEENRQKIARLSALLEEAEQQKDAVWQDSLQTRKELLEITNRQTGEQRKNKEDLEKELTESYIYRKFHGVSNGVLIELEEEDWHKLQQAVEQTYEGFSSRLYTLYPKLSPIELRICYLLKISVSVTHIAHLLGRSKSSISIARTRLYGKLFEAPGTSEDLDAFIASL